MARATGALQVIGGTREPLKRLARGLPAQWYTDPTHYKRELERIWYARWIACCREEELPSPGDYRVVAIGTQSILVVRGADGPIRAFHNTCRHRGSILTTSTQGNFGGGAISCPYHAWTYDLAGTLTLTPRQMITPDFDPRRFGLHAVRVDRWAGIVFVHLGGGRPAALSLAPALGELPRQFARYELDRLRLGHRIELDVAANWKLLVENFGECFHCPVVHPELCRIVPAYRDAGAWGLHRDARGRALPESTPMFAARARTLTLDGTSSLEPFRQLDEQERAHLYEPALVAPNLFLNVHPDYVHTHMMFPTGPTSVRMVYDWLFAPEALGPSFDPRPYVELWKITNEQDAQNCTWQQRGLTARPFEHGWYVPQEFDSDRFARWVRASLRARPAGIDRRARR